METQEFQEIHQQLQRPLYWHFLLCPHSPPNIGGLLSRAGEPVLTDYSKVAWKALAVSLQAELNGNVPKSISVCVSDDAVDIMDVCEMSTLSGKPLGCSAGFHQRTLDCVNTLTMKDMRAGITKLSDKPGLHVNTPFEGKRPPLGAFVVSLKFTNSLQSHDYLQSCADTIFGCVPGPCYFADNVPETGKPNRAISKWLGEQFGVVYGELCTTSFLGLTLTAR